LRVVFLTHHYPRWPGDLSGAALASLARALLRRGISVRVVAPGDAASGPNDVDGIAVRRVRIAGLSSGSMTEPDSSPGGVRRPLGWGSVLRLWLGLRVAARQEAAAADLVHAHRWAPAGLATPADLPLVLTIHGSDVSLLRRSRIARSLARPLLQRAAVVTAVTRQVGDWAQSLAGRFIGPGHIHPMPVDSRGHPWTRGGGGAVVIGGLTPSARVELAVETVAVLASCGHQLPLVVIGEGPHRPFIQQRATELGVSQLVQLVGNVSPELRRGYLSRADLMLCTGSGEEVTWSALEAFISGVPVIACWDGGATVDVVPQSGAGRLTLPSAEALADSVLELQADRDRLAIGRLVGEAWRARLAPDHVAELCEGWYRDALRK
jgi:glycosyltransferase involved in cell wall biosynthesis